MEVTLHRNQVAALAVLLLVAAGAFYAWRVFFQPRPVPINPGEEPAIAALRQAFRPDVTLGRDAWQAAACAGMTANGCELFKSVYAPVIWQAALSGKTTQTDPVFVSVAEDKGAEQVWQFVVDAQPVYVHVIKGSDSRWLLARILFKDEAQARYRGH